MHPGFCPITRFVNATNGEAGRMYLYQEAELHLSVDVAFIIVALCPQGLSGPKRLELTKDTCLRHTPEG